MEGECAHVFVYGSAGVRLKGKPSDWSDLAAAADPLRGSLGGHALEKKKRASSSSKMKRNEWRGKIKLVKWIWKYGNEDHV